MNSGELAPWIALSLIPGLGNEGMRRLMMIFGTPEQVFSAPVRTLKQHVKSPIAERIGEGVNIALLKPATDWLTQENNSLVILADEDYPQALLNIPDPPVLLYAKGNRTLLKSPALAIVGSRHATAQGIANSTSFAETLSSVGLCIVSGMAHGVDAAAHRGALTGKGSSIAVVGTGLDRIYPAANRELAHTLSEKGLLLSEFPLGTPPLAANFPRRNRIISGLSLGCLVVEASLQSGSLITARLALEQGREVFAIPGSIHAPQAKGCHHLIKQGAKLVESAQDILDELQNFTTIQPIQEESTDAPNSEHSLLPHLGFDPINLDTLSMRSGLTIEALSAILLQLELEGLVATLPGGLYQRVI